MSLNMIVIFLLVISGMLFAIFFYMINVQKLGIYGILKALGVKTGKLFQMMWAQMLIISVVSLILSIVISRFPSAGAERDAFSFNMAGNNTSLSRFYHHWIYRSYVVRDSNQTCRAHAGYTARRDVK